MHKFSKKHFVHALIFGASLFASEHVIAAEYRLVLFNIDDFARAYVNGVEVLSCPVSRTCEVNLDPHLHSGTNKVAVRVWNTGQGYTWGYLLLKSDRAMFGGSCGIFGTLGCNNNDHTIGIVKFIKHKIRR